MTLVRWGDEGRLFPYLSRSVTAKVAVDSLLPFELVGTASAEDVGPQTDPGRTVRCTGLPWTWSPPAPRQASSA